MNINGISYKSNGSNKSMRQMSSVRLTEVGVQSAMANNKKYTLADDVQIYLRKNGEYYLTAVSAVSVESCTLTGWYDAVSGGRPDPHDHRGEKARCSGVSAPQQEENLPCPRVGPVCDFMEETENVPASDGDNKREPLVGGFGQDTGTASDDRRRPFYSSPSAPADAFRSQPPALRTALGPEMCGRFQGFADF